MKKKFGWWTDNKQYAHDFLTYTKKHNIKCRFSMHSYGAWGFYPDGWEVEYDFKSWVRLLPYWPLHKLGFFKADLGDCKLRDLYSWF